MTNVFLSRIALNVMMCLLGCTRLGRNVHSDGATCDNKPCVGVKRVVVMEHGGIVG
jgi:hypothetical protein